MTPNVCPKPRSLATSLLESEKREMLRISLLYSPSSQAVSDTLCRSWFQTPGIGSRASETWRKSAQAASRQPTPDREVLNEPNLYHKEAKNAGNSINNNDNNNKEDVDGNDDAPFIGPQNSPQQRRGRHEHDSMTLLRFQPRSLKYWYILWGKLELSL